MNTFSSPVQDMSANATADTHDIKPAIKDDKLGRSTEVEVDSDTSSSYTDSESSPRRSVSPNGMGTGVWSKEEHARFLEAIKIYANGPWKVVATYVGTRTVRQTMTHAQKYRQKAARRLRGLRTKQALMRMNFGHHVSEESLMQERLRTMGAAHNNHRVAYEQTQVNYYSLPGTVAVEQRGQCSDTGALPWAKQFTSESAQEPSCLDATLLALEDIDLLEDLTASPTLEECATELLKVLF
ncbi:unnamed protein product [Peronospora destructor]|uniref:HTH myb-type domain-containing protein n=1 Tax=Peronospora destructor TaxID=86335 RepID=A0AAV0UJ86_9STRA|nr:unnamed protein product [Peronospora destructor]